MGGASVGGAGGTGASNVGGSGGGGSSVGGSGGGDAGERRGCWSARLQLANSAEFGEETSGRDGRRGRRDDVRDRGVGRKRPARGRGEPWAGTCRVDGGPLASESSVLRGGWRFRHHDRRGWWLRVGRTHADERAGPLGHHDGVWRSGPPMPTARANAMGAVWNGKLAVIGSGTQYGATEATGVIELYDPGANTWSSSRLAVTPRAAGVAVVDSAGNSYVIGGALQNSLYGDPIVEVVTATGITAGPPLTLGRVQIAGGLLSCGIVVAGGWTAAGDTPIVEGLLGARSVAIFATHADESRRRGRRGDQRQPDRCRRRPISGQVGLPGRGRGARHELVLGPRVRI